MGIMENCVPFSEKFPMCFVLVCNTDAVIPITQT